MSDTAELLFANEAFYHVFRSRDLAAMEDLWARHAPVICVHPGWQALTTRDAVMESWRGILTNPEAPSVDCRAAHAHLLGALGVVVCYEILGPNVLVATNLFLREDGAWRMAHHHAGPCGVPPAELAEEPPVEPMQ
jgi:hypothetical protein